MAVYECVCRACKHIWSCTDEEYTGICPNCGSNNIWENDLEDDEESEA